MGPIPPPPSRHHRAREGPAFLLLLQNFRRKLDSRFRGNDAKRELRISPMNEEQFDMAVIGAGFGGIYAAWRFANEGRSVIGIEGAPGVGGTWYHNGYPGSRVDTDSVDLYSYLFSQEIYDG